MLPFRRVEFAEFLWYIEEKLGAAAMKVFRALGLGVYARADFMLAEDGVSYIYSEEPSTAFDLVWSAADCEFRLPVKVVSNTLSWILQ